MSEIHPRREVRIVLKTVHRGVQADVEIELPDGIGGVGVAEAFQRIDKDVARSGADTQAVVQQADIVVQGGEIHQRLVHEAVRTGFRVEEDAIEGRAIGEIDRVAMSGKATVVGIIGLAAQIVMLATLDTWSVDGSIFFNAASKPFRGK